MPSIETRRKFREREAPDSQKLVELVGNTGQHASRWSRLELIAAEDLAACTWPVAFSALPPNTAPPSSLAVGLSPRPPASVPKKRKRNATADEHDQQKPGKRHQKGIRVKAVQHKSTYPLRFWDIYRRPFYSIFLARQKKNTITCRF